MGFWWESVRGAKCGGVGACRQGVQHNGLQIENQACPPYITFLGVEEKAWERSVLGTRGREDKWGGRGGMRARSAAQWSADMGTWGMLTFYHKFTCGGESVGAKCGGIVRKTFQQ